VKLTSTPRKLQKEVTTTAMVPKYFPGQRDDEKKEEASMRHARFATRLVERYGLTPRQALRSIIENDSDVAAKSAALNKAPDDKKEQNDLEKKFKEQLKKEFDSVNCAEPDAKEADQPFSKESDEPFSKEDDDMPCEGDEPADSDEQDDDAVKDEQDDDDDSIEQDDQDNC